jgi:hypothetical protein
MRYCWWMPQIVAGLYEVNDRTVEPTLTIGFACRGL